jgi:hypothetical protein
MNDGVFHLRRISVKFPEHFYNLYLFMCSEMFHCLRNKKQLNIWNATKLNGIHERKQEKIYKTKRNFIFDETKRNEISLFFCFAKQTKFRETILLFRIVSCFAKQKKGSEMETLIMYIKVIVDQEHCLNVVFIERRCRHSWFIFFKLMYIYCTVE